MVMQYKCLALAEANVVGGPNCMAVALNKAINKGFPLTLATGEQVPTIDVFQPHPVIIPLAAGKALHVVLIQSPAR